MNHQQKLQSPIPNLLLNRPKNALNFQPDIMKPQGNESMVFAHQNENFNQKHMKQLVQQIRFKQKMQAINKKKGKYKRSTNNCHKKYIGILKNLLFLKLSAQKKNQILSDFNRYRNSRVYYFIIMSYLKWYLDAMDVRWIFQHFCQEVEAKVSRFRLEINTTNNSNFVSFRKDQIIQLQYALQSINYFLRGFAEESIRVLYQKNKYIIIKRNQYLRTLHIIKQLDKNIQNQFENVSIQQKIMSFRLDEVYRWNKDISFNDIESIEKLSKIKEKEEENSSQQSQFSNDDEQSDEVKLNYKQKKLIQQKQITKIEKNIKMEQMQYDPDVQYPLIGLQNSYKIITQVDWYSWIIQKQKTLQFTIKRREGELIKNAQQKGFQMQKSFLFNNNWGFNHRYENIN